MDYTIVTTFLNDLDFFFTKMNKIFKAVQAFGANGAKTVTFYRDHIRG